MRRVDITNFREFDKRYLIVTNLDAKAKMLLAASKFIVRPDDNAMLVFAYIDYMAGISFRVLCSACVFRDGRVALGLSNTTTGLLLRQDSFQGTFYTYDDPEYLLPFEKYTDSVKKSYQVGNEVLEVRKMREIDHLRAPGFPDDILVHFFKEGFKPEGIWCRVTGTNYAKRRIMAEMLNEPYAEIGVHQGDEIGFGLFNDSDGDLMAVAFLDD